MPAIWFVDTSILLELLAVPGLCSDSAAVRAEAQRRLEGGDRFVIPVTTLVETGNHIAQIKGGDRRAAAERFAAVVAAAGGDDQHWVLSAGAWSGDLVRDVLAGAGTGSDFVDHASRGEMGTGDLAILAERRAFAGADAFERRIWTLDVRLAAYE